MNQDHRYTLEPYKTPKSRFRCPQCNDPIKTFSRYIDTETQQYLGETVGRCSREHNCGYHYSPKQYFDNHIEAGIITAHHNDISLPFVHYSVIPKEDVSETLNNYNNNNLVIWLSRQLGNERAIELVKQYGIGTSDHWPGASIFWQTDAKGQTRTGKIMLYDANTGKRVKQPFNHIHWAHKLKYAGYYLKQCLFGEHLLATEPNKPVGIVESEKTALLAAAHSSQYVWLATGGLQNLNAAVCQVLKGRSVELYPDVGAFDKWQQKAVDLQLLINKTRFSVSDLLETNATEQQRKEGWDLGDYLVG